MSVAMLIMGILLTLIVPAVVHMFNPTMQAAATQNSSNQLDLAFMQLDSEVRYASQIWAPYAGTPSSDNGWDIEYESTFAGAQEPTCTELKYNYGTGQLLQAAWSEGSTTAPPFEVLATGLTGTADPFAIVSNSYNEKVQLTVTLSDLSGTGTAKATTSSSVTFTALNSTSNLPATSSDCTASWTAA
jgi:type II secretory pathway pseudopilin PulG